MAKSPNQKLKLLYIARYLQRETDETHPVTIAQIIAELARWDINAERKSIYDDIDALERFGLDIQQVRTGSSTGYFVGVREFQLPELRLLVDSVQSSRFITARKSMELIDKIESLCSVYQARSLHRQVYVKNRIKTMNESIYYNVDEIHSAIAQDRIITFKYFAYNVSKQRVFRRSGQLYRISPLALTWDNENYYLIGYDAREDLIKHFRVDKMAEITETGLPREGKAKFVGMDMAAYADSHFGMFSGEVTAVRLEFVDALAGSVIDRFGRDLLLVPGQDGRFTVTVNCAVNEQFFGWLCGFGDRVKLLSPDWAAQQMRNHLAAIAARYADTEDT